MLKEFEEIRFPEDISYGMHGGPEYHTDILTATSGKEYRNVNWLHGRNRYNVAHAVKSKNQFDELLAFFRARKGRAVGFRFKDWFDYEAKNQKIGIGDGKTKEFQLIKTYESGDNKDVRIITKPVMGTVVVYVGGVKAAPNIDYTSGKILFATPPQEAGEIRADFEFDVPVRFDNDHLVAISEEDNSFSWGEIELVEVKI